MNNKTVLSGSNRNLAKGLLNLAAAANSLVEENTPAQLRQVAPTESKKAAFGLFPPPDDPKTNAEKKAVQKNVPEVQLEQIDEDIETSILLPPYIKGKSRTDLILAWKNIVSGQAFTGSYIEFYGQKWVYNDKVSAVYDCNRDIQRSYIGETFQNVFLNKNGWMGGSKRHLFLKSKFSLQDVNTLPGWKELQLRAKGANDVEPDIIVCAPRSVTDTGFNLRKPTVFIVEMKIGLGKSDSIPEHHQLCRTKRLIEKWLDEFETSIRNRKNTAYPGWERPEVKLVFVGWAAPTPDRVVFKVPGRTIGTAGSAVMVPYVNQGSGTVFDAYSVTKTNSEGYGKLSGVRASFVSKIIEDLNFKRASAFYKVFAELSNSTTPLGRQVATNRNVWLRNYGSQQGPSLRNAVKIEALTKKKSSAAPGTIQKLSNSINAGLERNNPINAAIGTMLRNASTYNPAVVPKLINNLKQLKASRNNWLSLRNYMLMNNTKKGARATAILKNMVQKSVNNTIINNVFRNVYNTPQLYANAKRVARTTGGGAPAAVMAARGRGR